MSSFRTFLVTICAATAALALSHGASAGGVGPAPVSTTTVSGTNSANARSWVGGGHAGYNWQQGAVVYGFEADLQGTHLYSGMKDNLTANPSPLPPGSFAETIATIDWYGTVRARVGVGSGPWLVYGTGGLAYGGVDLRSNFSAFGLSTNLQTSQVKTGWVAGVGVEYLARPDLSFTLAYQYVDLGRVSGTSAITSFDRGSTTTLNQSATTNAQFQTVMAGVSWRFAPQPSYGAWAGGYAGAHVGGAWGNDADANYFARNTSIAPQ